MPSNLLARALTSASMMFVLACGGSNEDSAGTCEGPLGKPIAAGDLAGMTACCQAEAGQAHCLPNAQVPDRLMSFMAACDQGNSCIPDSMLLTGAAKPPTTCTAFGGQGVCLSRCIPKVADNAAALRPDTCTGADELCVPCISPLDNMPTGACDLLEFSKCVGDESMETPVSCDDPKTCNYESSCPAVIEPSTLESCGADAHCFDAASIPDPADAARLAKCSDPTKLCVPDVFLKTGNKFTPASCSSLNGAEGRCLSLVLPAVAKQAEMLPQDVCAASERCTPCFSPIDGMSTGACNLSCDTGPTQPPKLLAQCCSDRARCVPTTAIPDDQEDNLAQHECTSAELCVPDEILADGPFPACTGNSILLGNYTGVCLSECLDFGIQGFALSKGSCATGFKCAPCMQNGQPTGAPGC
jgi:hypothetical protein